jgi:hypothetical protein
MQPIQILVASILGLILLAYVLYPLFGQTPRMKVATSTGPLDLNDREQMARQSLQEVEFDFQLGNLDDKEYSSLRKRYMGRAVAELKQRQEQEQAIDAEIEAQLHQMKQHKSLESH